MYLFLLQCLGCYQGVSDGASSPVVPSHPNIALLLFGNFFSNKWHSGRSQMHYISIIASGIHWNKDFISNNYFYDNFHQFCRSDLYIQTVIKLTLLNWLTPVALKICFYCQQKINISRYAWKNTSIFVPFEEIMRSQSIWRNASKQPKQQIDIWK